MGVPPGAAKSVPAWSLLTPVTGFLRQPYSLEMRLYLFSGQIKPVKLS